MSPKSVILNPYSCGIASLCVSTEPHSAEIGRATKRTRTWSGSINEYVSHCESLWKLTNFPAVSCSGKYLTKRPHTKGESHASRCASSEKVCHVRELPDIPHVLPADARAAVWPDILEPIHHDAPQLRDRHLVLLVLVLVQVVDKVACTRVRFSSNIVS